MGATDMGATTPDLDLDINTESETEITLGSDILPTDGQIALFVYGVNNAKTRGRVRQLMCHIKPVEHRLPSCLLGGQRTSFRSWIWRWILECKAREEARARIAAENKDDAKAAAEAVGTARHIRRTGRPRTSRDASPPGGQS